MSNPNQQVAVAERGIQSLAKANVSVGSMGLVMSNIDELFRFAQAVAGSALAPKDFVGKPESIVVAIQMGMEVGLPPMAALQNIAVINGRPSIWGDAQLAIVRSTIEGGKKALEAFEETETNDEIESIFRELCFEEDDQKRKQLKIKIAQLQAKMNRNADDFGVSCFVRRAGFSEAFSRFTVADAKTAGLWKKAGPWTQYPFRMLKARARSFLLRDQFGDALKGMMSREEAGDIIDVATTTTSVPTAELPDTGTGGAPVTTPLSRRRRERTTTEPQPAPEKASAELPACKQPAGVHERDGETWNCKHCGESMVHPATTETPAVDSESAPTENGATSAGTTSHLQTAVEVQENQKASASTERAATSTAEPAAGEPEFIMPKSNMSDKWLPTLDADDPKATYDSLSEWANIEQIHVEEILDFARVRGMAKPTQKLSELATAKHIMLLRGRDGLREYVLRKRAGLPVK